MENFTHHNGIDDYRIDPKDLLGFPIFSQIPKHQAENGTMVFVIIDTKKYIYAKLNRVWTRMATASVILSNLTALNFGAIAPNTSADLTMALVGALDTNGILLGVGNAVYAGINMEAVTFSVWVSAPNVVTIRATNASAINTANPANGTFTVTTTQF